MICIKCKKENIPFFSASNNEITKQANNSQTQASSSINSFVKRINEFNQNHNSNDGDDDDDKLPINCEYIDSFYLFIFLYKSPLTRLQKPL